MKNKLVLLLLFLLAFVLQTTILPLYFPLGVRIDLLLVLLVSMSLILGPASGSLLVLLTGFLFDLYGVGYLGINSISRLLLGYLSGVMRYSIFPNHILIPVLAVGMASIFNNFLMALFSERLVFAISSAWLTRQVLPQAMVNMVLTLIVFPSCQLLVINLERRRFSRG